MDHPRLELAQQAELCESQGRDEGHDVALDLFNIEIIGEDKNR